MGIRTDLHAALWAVAVTDPDTHTWQQPDRPWQPPATPHYPQGREPGMIRRGRFVAGTPDTSWSPAQLRQPSLPSHPAIASRLWELLPTVQVSTATPLFASQDWQEPGRFPALDTADMATWPPAKLIKSLGQLWVHDGHHRVASAVARATTAGTTLRFPARIWDQDAARRIDIALDPANAAWHHDDPNDWQRAWEQVTAAA